MTIATTTATASSLQLQAHQRAWERIPPGAEIRVEQGSICLHQRLYLAHDWVYMPVHLGPGECYRVSAGGWLEIEALTSASLSTRPRRGLLSLLAAYWVRTPAAPAAASRI
jgi:hypothetical protein